jgi:hypothetical protein
MDQPYQLVLLDPRDSDEARVANARALAGDAAWGIKLRPALAAQCAGNFAPTGEGEPMPAILAAGLSAEPPPLGATLVALGRVDAGETDLHADLDSLGAMAVCFMRCSTVTGQADPFADGDVRGRLIELATYSWPSARIPPDLSAPVSAPRALTMIAADSTLPLLTRVQTVIEYLQTGGFTAYARAAQHVRDSSTKDV